MTNPDRHLNKYYPVLDHGFVALTNYMGDDQSIEQAARVSYGEGTRSVRKTRGLLRYLMRHRHTSPFEQVEIQIHAAMPMFVARQWVRHRTASLNEYSGRYSVMPQATYTPDEWRLQSKKNRQGSSEERLPIHKVKTLNDWQFQLNERAWKAYEYRLDMDVSRELARIDLPLSAYTEWYWKMDLHNLFHFLGLRLDPHAQWEIREYAKIIAGLAYEVAPLATEAFIDYNLNSYLLSNAEIEAIREIMDSEHTFLQDEYPEMSSREVSEFNALLFGDRNPASIEDFILDEREAISPEEARTRLHGED